MDALIFDFDGVLVDSEPLHIQAFREVLAPQDVTFTEADYFDRYVGYDDREAIGVAGRDNGRNFTDEDVADLVARKTQQMQRLLASVPPMPGAVELVRAAADASIPLAVCSGALKDEVVLACRAIGVLECFATIVSADQVARSKPDPESYRLSLQRLCESTGRTLAPQRCMAIEDTGAGIAAAHGAGMKVLAVTNTLPAELLTDADRVVESLADISLTDIEALIA